MDSLDHNGHLMMSQRQSQGKKNYKKLTEANQDGNFKQFFELFLNVIATPLFSVAIYISAE